jgi:hypothetical protein
VLWANRTPFSLQPQAAARAADWRRRLRGLCKPAVTVAELGPDPARNTAALASVDVVCCSAAVWEAYSRMWCALL